MRPTNAIPGYCLMSNTKLKQRFEQLNQDLWNVIKLLKNVFFFQY